ncbi:RNHCP domain-containing protein [Candidatus Peregrinibacteria bacterium]|nr:RNHCP domain-containing protein [Candidatus Peregrinibacteria bacterium]
MIFIPRQESFQCGHCGADVQPLKKGSCRNHCPQCLYSKHVDEVGPGDRASICHGLMEPIGIEQKGQEFMICHRCTTCGILRRNKSAPDDDGDTMIRVMQEQTGGITTSDHRSWGS